MPELRAYLDEVAEAFQSLTGGYTGIQEFPQGGPTGYILKCEIGDELVKVRAFEGQTKRPVTAFTVAIQIAGLFDRRPRAHGTRWVILPEQDLEHLQHLALER